MRIIFFAGLLVVLIGSGLAAAAPTELKMVTVADGVQLSASRWGNADGRAIVFVHGWSQAGASWNQQTGSWLAEKYKLVSFDLRGHGFSGKPEDPGAYTKPGVWGDDLALVVKAFGLEKPVLVGWSFGSEVLREYLVGHGYDDISGVVVVSGPASASDFGPDLLSVLPGMLSPYYRVNLAATIQFLRNAFNVSPGEQQFAEAVGINMSASVAARRGVIERVQPPQAEALRAATVPFLIIHGKEDRIILPSGAPALAGFIPDATVKLYDGVGHLPFAEAASRFNCDLDAFVAGLELSPVAPHID